MPSSRLEFFQRLDDDELLAARDGIERELDWFNQFSNVTRGIVAAWRINLSKPTPKSHAGSEPTNATILDKAVQKIRASGVKASSAYPIAVASLQKPGPQEGTLAATAKGTKRGKMSAKQRAATR
jgi:hypothetical protein